MDLSEFVRISLIEIARGVKAAIADADIEQLFLRINPAYSDRTEGWEKYERTVEFDVAVTTTETKTSGGKAGLRVWALEVGGDVSSSAQAATVSRVKFAVPVLLAAHPTIANKS
jgi:hypothetical protein